MPQEDLLSKAVLLPSMQDANPGKASGVRDVPVAKYSGSPGPLRLGRASLPQESAAL